MGQRPGVSQCRGGGENRFELRSRVLAEGLQFQWRSGGKPSDAENKIVERWRNLGHAWRSQQEVRWGRS